MFIASARVEIFIYNVQSIKEKRNIIKSVIRNIQNKFNLSVAEVDFLDIWQRGALGLACVSNSYSHAEQQINNTIRFLEDDVRFEISYVDVNVL